MLALLAAVVLTGCAGAAQSAPVLDPEIRARSAMLEASEMPLSGMHRTADGATAYEGRPGWRREYIWTGTINGGTPASVFVGIRMLYLGSGERDAVFSEMRERLEPQGRTLYSGTDPIMDELPLLVTALPEEKLTTSTLIRMPEGLIWVLASGEGLSEEGLALLGREVARTQVLRALSR